MLCTHLTTRIDNRQREILQKIQKVNLTNRELILEFLSFGDLFSLSLGESLILGGNEPKSSKSPIPALDNKYTMEYEVY